MRESLDTSGYVLSATQSTTADTPLWSPLTSGLLDSVDCSVSVGVIGWASLSLPFLLCFFLGFCGSSLFAEPLSAIVARNCTPEQKTKWTRCGLSTRAPVTGAVLM